MGCVTPGLYPRRKGWGWPGFWERTGGSPAKDPTTARTPSKESSYALGGERTAKGKRARAEWGDPHPQL